MWSVAISDRRFTFYVAFPLNGSRFGVPRARRARFVNRLQKIAVSAQPSRIPKASTWYDRDFVTGRGLNEVDDFEVVGGAAVEADTDLG